MRELVVKGVALVAVALSVASAFARDGKTSRPNILWITCEDISPNVGCYGDRYARTPRLDRFAAEGVRYSNAYATAPVCSPARSCIITGVHAESLGTQHLRNITRKPASIRCFTEYLREAGYYTTNNSKQDYQFATPAGAWNASSGKAHWRARPAGRPFFSVFNLTMTHQSQTRYPGDKLRKVNGELPPDMRHDPGDAPVPPYYPDTPRVRENLAAYHTQITLMDRAVGRHLDQLAEDGLADDTIVFFFSDHGGGIPRHKRWLHRSGTHVPFIIRCPEKYRHLVPGAPGSVDNRLVSFADLAPTILSLVGLPLPGYLQGRAFLGGAAREPRKYVFASRDRVDEVILWSRTVLSDRYQYIRNFHPHRSRMPLSNYSERTPIRQEVRRLSAAGALSVENDWLARTTTPAEELYDLSADPHEMVNLAASAEHRDVLTELRRALYAHMQEVRDTGLFTESEMRTRMPNTPYEGMRRFKDAELSAILDTAQRVGMGIEHRGELIRRLGHPENAVRYWAAVGLLVLGDDAAPAEIALTQTLEDSSPSVRIAAAEALCRLGREEVALPVLTRELDTSDDTLAVETTTALLAVGEKAKPAVDALRAVLRRKSRYASSNVRHILAGLGLQERTAQAVSGPAASRPAGAIDGIAFGNGSGIQPGRCTEGGQCIGWIDNGDWAEYEIDVKAQGRHKLDFRVASQHSKGGTIHLVLNGKRIAAVDVPNTGSWQKWTTVSVDARFPKAGRQTLRLSFAGGEGCLLNVSWFKLVHVQ